MKKIERDNKKIELEKKDIDFVFSKLGFSTTLDFNYHRDLLLTKLYDTNEQETTTVFYDTKVNPFELELLTK